jgi:hypothetical protein
MTTTMDNLTLAIFAGSWAVLHIGHNLGDHVTGQTDHQATGKGAPTPDQVERGAHRHAGWAANLAHVAHYHLTLVIVGLLAWLALPLHWSVTGVVLALVWSAATHAFLDRRWPVRWLLEHTGSPGFARLAAGGINGMYLADQGLHGLALGIAAVLLAVTAG